MEDKQVTLNYVRIDGFEKPTENLSPDKIKKYYLRLYLLNTTVLSEKITLDKLTKLVNSKDTVLRSFQIGADSNTDYTEWDNINFNLGKVDENMSLVILVFERNDAYKAFSLMDNIIDYYFIINVKKEFLSNPILVYNSSDTYLYEITSVINVISTLPRAYADIHNIVDKDVRDKYFATYNARASLRINAQVDEYIKKKYGHIPNLYKIREKVKKIILASQEIMSRIEKDTIAEVNEVFKKEYLNKYKTLTNQQVFDLGESKSQFREISHLVADQGAKTYHVQKPTSQITVHYKLGAN